MGKMKCLVVITLIALLNGCTTAPKRIEVGRNIGYKTETIKKPAIGITTTANIGESIISTSKKQIVTTLVLNEDIIHNGKYAGLNHVFRVSKGYLPLTQINSKGRFFSAETGISKEVAGKLFYDLGGIFLYDNKPNFAAIFWIESATGNYYIEPIPNIDAKIIEKEEWSSESFNRELIYTGKSGNTISVLYREFMDNMARPSFTHEIKYDLSDIKSIGYKNARFEIIDADNLSIRYKVLKHLE